MMAMWAFKDSDDSNIRHLMETMGGNAFVKERERRNLKDRPQHTDVGEFWKLLVCCLLTTRQQSGPDSPIQLCIRARPEVLDFRAVGKAENIAAWSAASLEAYGLRRDKEKIPEHIAKCFAQVSKHWAEGITPQLARLRRNTSPAVEREVADYIDKLLHGFGPKQARNLLQLLGLTRDEIPIDGRVMAWLNAHDFAVPLAAGILSDETTYAFVMDAIMELCIRSDLPPCLFDAMVFAAVDERNGRPWTKKAVRENAWYNL